MSALTRALALLLVVGALPAVAAEEDETRRPKATRSRDERDGRDAKDEKTAKPLPLYHGVHVEILGGFFGQRAAVDKRRALVDPFGGLRVAYRRTIGPVILGGEDIFRTTPFANVGAAPILPLNLLARSLGDKPHQGLRQVNQISVGGTLAYRLKRLDWFLEPFATAGLSHSFRTFLVELDSPLFFNRSFPALGVYGGMGFLTGLEPVFVRMDAVFNPEVGPPPFTSRIVQVQYNIGLGIRL